MKLTETGKQRGLILAVGIATLKIKTKTLHVRIIYMKENGL